MAILESPRPLLRLNPYKLIINCIYMATIINNRRDGYAGDPAADSAVGMFLGIILAVIMLLLAVRFLFPSLWFFNGATTQQPSNTNPTINVTLPGTSGSQSSGQPTSGTQSSAAAAQN